MPRAQQQLILATDEVWGFLGQKNISAKNIARLEALIHIQDTDFQFLRRMVWEIAHVMPRKRRRWSFIRQNHPKLYRQIVAAGWCADYDLEEIPHWKEDPDDVDDFDDFDGEEDWESLSEETRGEILGYGRGECRGD